MKQDRRVPQKLFASNTERCPVKVFELLISDLHTCGPLYLTHLRKPRPSVRYSVQPVGESKIKTYMKTMASLAGIDKSGKRYTNHSVHKTTLQKLQKADISNDKIAAFTGHKREPFETMLQLIWKIIRKSARFSVARSLMLQSLSQ